MIKVLLLSASLLLILSCGETNEACQYIVTRSLDKGMYDEVIKRLENKSCGYSEKERYINLGAAYAGKAGIDPLDIARELIDASRTGQESEKVIMEMLDKKASGTGLFYMNKASDSYKRAIGNNISICREMNIDELSKDACFYGSLISFSLMASSFNLLVENVGLWIDKSKLDCSTDVNRNNNLDTADASGCAIKYGINGTTDCNNGITVDHASVVSNISIKGFNFEYVPVNIKADTGKCPGKQDKTIHKMLYVKEDGSKSLAITEGFCSPQDINNKCDISQVDGVSCVPCPVFTEDLNGNIVPATVESTVANVVNEASDMAIDEETRNAINDFVNTYCGQDGCSESEIGNYLYGG